jgi:hypothetical protein
MTCIDFIKLDCRDWIAENKMDNMLDNASWLLEMLNKISAILIIILLLITLSGCASYRYNPQSLPPIMTLEELKQPYLKLGTLEYETDRFGAVESLTVQDMDWAHTQLREGAKKLAADAVIYPEVRVLQNSIFLIPSSTIKAKGTAIRFR